LSVLSMFNECIKQFGQIDILSFFFVKHVRIIQITEMTCTTCNAYRTSVVTL
jgi:hypothetical protein